MGKKRKPGVSDEEREKREQELHAFIYKHEDDLKIVQYEKYHFRIFKGNRCVDVWPVSYKYYATWFTKSRIYSNPEEILKAFKEAPKTK